MILFHYFIFQSDILKICDLVTKKMALVKLDTDMYSPILKWYVSHVTLKWKSPSGVQGMDGDMPKIGSDTGQSQESVEPSENYQTDTEQNQESAETSENYQSDTEQSEESAEHHENYQTDTEQCQESIEPYENEKYMPNSCVKVKRKLIFSKDNDETVVNEAGEKSCSDR